MTRPSSAFMSDSFKVDQQKRTQVCLPLCMYISLLQSFSKGTPRIGMAEDRRGGPCEGGSLEFCMFLLEIVNVTTRNV